MFIKRKDTLLAIAVLILAFVCFIVFRLMNGMDSNKDQAYLLITVNGDTYGKYSMAEDQQIKINGTNTCEISSGTVKMTEADCPDQLCIHQKELSEPGSTIVCLPNRVVLSIISDKEPQIDSVAG